VIIISEYGRNILVETCLQHGIKEVEKGLGNTSNVQNPSQNYRDILLNVFVLGTTFPLTTSAWRSACSQHARMDMLALQQLNIPVNIFIKPSLGNSYIKILLEI